MENIIRSIRRASPHVELNSTILAGSGHCLSLQDSLQEDGFQHHLIHIEELNYFSEIRKIRKKEIENLLKKLIQNVPLKPNSKNVKTVVIGHNVPLGKNPLLTAVFAEWAKIWKKALFFSLIHDFPEDHRPGNVEILQKTFGKKEISSVLYPNLANFHFITINSRDFHALKKAGVPLKKLHTISNVVDTSRFSILHPVNRMEALKKLWLDLEE
jgi:hypothetical protein